MAALFWFAMMLVGQWAFFYYIAAFYGKNVASGDFAAVAPPGTSSPV